MPQINFNTSNGLAHIEFASPKTGNALSYEMIDELSTLCGKLDPTTRAVLITAQGKHFCVGGDLKSFAASDEPRSLIRAMADRLHEGILALDTLSVPVVIAVQGSAAGAGLSLVASADILLAGEDAKFVLAYPQIGFAADGGSSYYLARTIGLRRAQEMVYLGRYYNADEAVEFGLATRKVTNKELQSEALKIARKLAKGPTLAFKEIRALYGATFQNDLRTQLDLESNAIAKTADSGDGKSGVKAFLEKRKPNFDGS